jgi:EAL and modified HD-GYP domain-containing signal transduction protein
VKIDVLERTEDELREIVTQLLPYGVRLLAERVEEIEIRDQCLALGFDLFQGYFYAKPETISKREPSASQLAILRLLNLLRDPNVADSALDTAFGTDVNLTYKLLRMVNSAATGARGIESIGHAVRLLGRAPLHRWLSLLFVSSLAAEGGIKIELTQAALVRARLCELIANGSSATGARRDPGTAFMVGLFSMIDALMRTPMAEVLARVDVSDDVRKALLHREGMYASPLFLAEAYEQGNWSAVRSESKDLGIAGQDLAKMYLESIGWAREQMTAK